MLSLLELIASLSKLREHKKRATVECYGGEIFQGILYIFTLNIGALTVSERKASYSVYQTLSVQLFSLPDLHFSGFLQVLLASPGELGKNPLKLFVYC